jgi:PAS domain S-box-containing protein
MFFAICLSIAKFIETFSYSIRVSDPLFFIADIFSCASCIFLFIGAVKTYLKLGKKHFIKWLVFCCIIMSFIVCYFFGILILKRVLFFYLFISSWIILLISIRHYCKEASEEKKIILAIFRNILLLGSAICLLKFIKCLQMDSLSLFAVIQLTIALVTIFTANLLFKYFKTKCKKFERIQDYMPFNWEYLSLAVTISIIFIAWLFISNCLQNRSKNVMIKNAEYIVADIEETISIFLKKSEQVCESLSNYHPFKKALISYPSIDKKFINKILNTFRCNFDVSLIYVLDSNGQILFYSDDANQNLNKIYNENSLFFNHFKLNINTNKIPKGIFIKGEGYYSIITVSNNKYKSLWTVVIKSAINEINDKIKNYNNIFVVDQNEQILISDKKNSTYMNLQQFFNNRENSYYHQTYEINGKNIILINNESFYIYKKLINGGLWSIVYLIPVNSKSMITLNYLIISALIIIILLLYWVINQSARILALAFQNKAILNSTISIIIIYTDLHGKIVIYGQGSQNIIGYKFEELLQKGDFNKLFFDKEKKSISFDDAVNFKHNVDLEWLCQRKDGIYITVRMNIIPQFSIKGTLIGYIFSGVDISNAKRVEVALEQQLQFLQTLIDNIPVAIYYKDVNMHLMGCNKVFEKIMEHPKVDMIGVTSEDMYFDKHAKNISIKTDLHLSKTMSSISYETSLASQKAGLRNIVFHKSAFKTFDGKFNGIIGVILDVTKERNMQVERDKLQANLIQQNKLASLGELAGGIAHELNNPLSIIFGFAQILLRDKTLGEETVKGIKNIYDAAQRSQKIIKNMLEFSRAGSSKIQKLNLNNVIETTLLIIEKDFYNANIEIIKNFTKKPAYVMINPMQMQQVLLNIILNAKDAMPKGGKLTITTIVKNKKYILSISDTGVGIKRKNISKIFDPFFTTKETGKGTGLGLSICYGIVKALKGKILVESTTGKGTTFYITFPVRY